MHDVTNKAFVVISFLIVVKKNNHRNSQMNDHGLKFDDCVKETFGFICWVLINLLKSRCSYYNLSVDDAIAARAPTQPSATRARTW